MKRMKKLLAALLTLTMVLGMTVTAFASSVTDEPADPEPKAATGKSGDVGTITIDGLASNDVTVTAYQIIEAKYEGQDGLFSGYRTTYEGDPVVKFTDDKNNKVLLSDISNQINNLNYLNAVIPHTKNMTGKEADDITANGTDEKGKPKYLATFNNLPVGSYVIMISGTEANTYNPVIASIYYDVKDLTANVLQEGSVNLVGDNAWAKRSDSPDVVKKIVEGENRVDSNNVNVGDVITYEVKIKPIPEYDGKFPILKIRDTLGTGLVLTDVENIKVQKVTTTDVKSDLDEDFYSIVEARNGQKSLIIDFAPDYNYQLNDLAKEQSYVLITYKAELTADAVQYNQNANENTVVLDYTNDSKIDKGQEPDKKEDKTYTYTFDLDIEGTITKKIITKTGDANEVDLKGLKDAEFTLYATKEQAEAEDGTPYSNADLVAEKWTNPIVSTEAGQLPIKGLAAGTYYLKETKAPAGYSINTHIYEIKISAVEYEESGKIKSWTISVDGKNLNTFAVTEIEDENGNVSTQVTLGDKVVVQGGTMVEGYNGEHAAETEIKNTTLTTLPSTGGIGTTIFTIAGCLIMIAAAGLFFFSRRKAAK